MSAERLKSTIGALVSAGRGILAADESTPTITRRFQALRIPSTEWTRRDWRELLISTPAVAGSISGVILYDETFHQLTADGTGFPEAIEQRGMIPGIKVDTGTRPLPGSNDEKVTGGLDGLEDRLGRYVELGARFAKWRAVISVGDGRPSAACLEMNARSLGRYAAICQQMGLVPIVEPEVLMDGKHTIDRCAEVTRQTLRQVFLELSSRDVALDTALLKPNMVLSGADCPRAAGVEDVADATLSCLREVVPADLGGIVFLSGGQSPAQATSHLRAINGLGRQPWELSFSFGRALQQDAMAAWRGDPANVPAAQAAFMERARANGWARKPTVLTDAGEAAA